MATIKDVAKAAGVSPTTVSLIINGKSKERRISEETAERVYEVMNKLGYRPNMAARRLRAVDNSKPIIAFYWPSDYRSNILASFLMHFQEATEALHFDCEIIIRNYLNNHLDEVSDAITKNSYNGIIIGATSGDDVKYLEGLKTRTPIVLLNRKSEIYSTVGSDNKEIGLMAARLFKMKGFCECAVMTSLRPYVATGARTQAFLMACAQLDLNVEASHVYRGENTIEGGVKAAEAYCDDATAPHIIFCDSDSMALGAMYTFHKRGIRLPDDVQFLAIQLLEEDYTKYSIPSISTIAMPNQKIAYQALSIIQKAIRDPKMELVHELVEPQIVIRETFQ